MASRVKDFAFIYNGLHFPQIKLVSEKPPEAVLGVIFKIFPESMPPDPPTLCRAKHAIPHGNLARQFFVLRYTMNTNT